MVSVQEQGISKTSEVKVTLEVFVTYNFGSFLPCRLRQLVCVQKDEAILEHSNEPLQALERFYCLTKTTSCASGSEKLLAMYQKKSP